mmetsp:Transcript_23957/g.42227  ORF Transcript_23957/g.42227 Transcript_23957/m.42227 type:complete len:206 (+) Transcript_23957:190-807(+)
MEDPTVNELVEQIVSRSKSFEYLDEDESTKSGSPSLIALASKDSSSVSKSVVKPSKGPAPPGLDVQHGVAVISGFHFATVILIVQKRIPLASSVELFVILSILFMSASHSKIIELLPERSSIQTDREAIKFLIFVFPLFVYMIITEIWFLALLFQFSPEVDLIEFGANASTVLNLCKVLSLMKMTTVVILMIFPRLHKVLTKRWR